MDSSDFAVSRSAGPTSHPIKMDITHRPTNVTISGTGRDDQRLMSELITRLTEIVAGYGPRVEQKTDDQVIAEALQSVAHRKPGRPKKAA